MSKAPDGIAPVVGSTDETLKQREGSSQQASAIRFLWVADCDRYKRVDLPACGTFLIGRAEHADLRLADPTISREQVRLQIGADSVALEHLGKNDTLVNGSKVTAIRQVHSGDVVQLGDVSLLLRARSTGWSTSNCIEAPTFRSALRTEAERARQYSRPFALICFHTKQSPPPAEVIVRVVREQLGSLCLLCWFSPTELFCLLAETPPESARSRTARLQSAEPSVFRNLSMGLSIWGADGCQEDALIGAARQGAQHATPGTCTVAQDLVTQRRLGDGQVLILADPETRVAYERIAKLAKTKTPVLIQGETGVGKELAARSLHDASPRGQGPFIPVNCAAIPKELFESELFGFVRGSFSGAIKAKKGKILASEGGTLFLDEIGELPLSLQAKLLRVLADPPRVCPVGSEKEIPVDVRVVAATNLDLEREVAEKRFREDLFFRVSAARIDLPPLRERPRELAALIRHCLTVFQPVEREGPLTLSEEAQVALSSFPWPGNLRQLRNAIETAAALAEDEDVIRLEHLPKAVSNHYMQQRQRELGQAAVQDSAQPETSQASASQPTQHFKQERTQFERAKILGALDSAGGDRKRAAESLGMPRRTLNHKIYSLGINVARPHVPAKTSVGKKHIRGGSDDE